MRARVNRIAGQVAGIQRMVDEDRYCVEILNQISAKNRTVRYAGRPASASTAVGQMSKHLAQLKQFLDEALG